MIKFLRNNNKKLLALFMVILMIAFILPTGFQGGRGEGPKRLIGHLGDEKIYDADFSRAKSQWDILAEYIIRVPQAPGEQPVPLFAAITQDRVLGYFVEQVSKHPEMFLLLQKEAARMGIVVSPAQVEAIFQSGAFQVRLPERGANVVPFEDIPDPRVKAQVRDALAAFMQVLAAQERAASVVKVSEPMVRHSMASELQEIRTVAVEVPAKDFVEKVTAPTTRQLEEHFNQYANYPVDAPATGDNPHGFGYRYPNRVTLQYVAVPRDLVRKVVRARQPDDRWDVQARQYYLRHADEFASTQPAEPPATRPSDALSLNSPANRPTTAPTTRPYDEVSQLILERLMAPEIERKSKEVQDRINAKLRVDWDAFQAARGKSQPTTAPTTIPADAGTLASYEYLQKLAADVEKQTGVLPTVGSIGEFKDAKDLEALAGIGEGTMNNTLSFADYATKYAAAVMSAGDTSKVHALTILQPSQVLKDMNESTYVFRLTGVKPSAKPESIAEVAGDVERDWKLARAYELAKADANQLVGAARAEGSLQSAARAANRASTLTGWFGKQSAGSLSMPVEGLALPPVSASMFRGNAFNLLNVAAAASTRPTTGPSTLSATLSATRPAPAISLVELPADETVFAVELAGVRHRFGNTEFSPGRAEVERSLVDMLSGGIRAGWFNFDSVVRRTGWRDESGRAPAAAKDNTAFSPDTAAAAGGGG